MHLRLEQLCLRWMLGKSTLMVLACSPNEAVIVCTYRLTGLDWIGVMYGGAAALILGNWSP